MMCFLQCKKLFNKKDLRLRVEYKETNGAKNVGMFWLFGKNERG